MKIRMDRFRPDPDRGDYVVTLTLDRPEAANALDGELMLELSQNFKRLAKERYCRALVLKGAGRNFCAGADIGWMKAAKSLSKARNLKEIQIFAKMLHGLNHLPFPTLAVAQGATYGGGVGLAACCDWIVAEENATFSLTEIRLGVVAAVILPYIARKIAPGSLRRLVLGGGVISAREAKDIGLVEVIGSRPIDRVVRDELADILLGEPRAQSEFKKLHSLFLAGKPPSPESLVRMLATLRVEKEGQAGLSAFFNRKRPEWAVDFPIDWKLP